MLANVAAKEKDERGKGQQCSLSSQQKKQESCRVRSDDLNSQDRHRGRACLSVGLFGWELIFVIAAVEVLLAAREEVGVRHLHRGGVVDGGVGLSVSSLSSRRWGSPCCGREGGTSQGRFVAVLVPWVACGAANVLKRCERWASSCRPAGFSKSRTSGISRSHISTQSDPSVLLMGEPSREVTSQLSLIRVSL
jgi:hypothetical protein